MRRFGYWLALAWLVVAGAWFAFAVATSTPASAVLGVLALGGHFLCRWLAGFWPDESPPADRT
jgi:hypothetical protein